MRKMKPFGGKMRKYAEGGATGVREGPNRNIDDETRQRAMDRMEARRVLESMKADEPKPRPKVTAPKPAPKPAAKPKPIRERSDTPDASMPSDAPRKAAAPARKMGIYERSRAVHGSKFLPDPIDTTPSNVDTPDIRRQARLRKEAAARRDARIAVEGGGFRKGGSIRGCGVARKGMTKGKMR